MPNNKLPGMEFEKRVAQLRQTLESVSRRIAGQQADVAALRQRLHDLVGATQLPEHERNRALTEIADGLGAQLRELQDAIARMQHAGAELRVCLTDLEPAVAGTGAPRDAGGVAGDAAMKALQARLNTLQAEFERLRDAGARRDQELLGGVAAMRERTAAMDQQLRQLIEAQEGLELQLALLSREAEQSLPPTGHESASAAEGIKISDLAERLDAIEQRLPVGEATAAPLQPDLVERLEGLESRTEHLVQQVAAQSSDGQTLQETIDGLGVQQVRQGNEVHTLKRRLRQRSLLALLLLLLGASLLVFALYRFTVPREAVQPAASTAAIAALRQELDALRSEKDRFNAALAQLSRSVDALATAPSPVELAVEIEQLGDRVNGLAEEGLQLSRRSDRLEDEQAGLRRELDVVVVELEALRQVAPPAPAGAADREATAAAAAGPPQAAGAPPASTAAAEAGASAKNGSLPSPAAATAPQPPTSPPGAAAAKSGPRPAAPAPTQDLPTTRPPPAEAAVGMTDTQRRPWEQAREQRHFTLQLIGVHEREHLAWFLKRHRLEAETAVHHTSYQGRPWLVLLYGIYDSQRAAMAAARRLPSDLAVLRPWVRQIPSRGRLEPL